MDNATFPTVTGSASSQERFIDFAPQYSTHLDRFVGIVERHAKNTSQWKDALLLYPVGSFESSVITDKLVDELDSMCEQAREAVTSLQSDMTNLANIIEKFMEEVEQHEQN